MKLSLPVCYFPTTVLVYGEYHSELDLQLEHQGPFSTVFCQDAQQVQHLMMEPSKSNVMSSALDKLSLLAELPESDQDMSVVAHEVFQSRRFDDISTLLILDTDLEKLEQQLLRMISHHHIRKVLYVPLHKLKQAQTLLKARLIDSIVINEQMPSLIKQLEISQRYYFLYMSQQLLRLLKIERPTCLGKKEYIKLLENIIQSKGAVEFYLLNEKGNCLLLCQDGTAYYLSFDHHGQPTLSEKTSTLAKIRIFVRDYDHYRAAGASHNLYVA